MEWRDLFVGLGLFLVLEGIMPFANPSGWRNTVETLLRVLDDQKLRMVGGGSMIAGLIIITLVR